MLEHANAAPVAGSSLFGYRTIDHQLWGDLEQQDGHGFGEYGPLSENIRLMKYPGIDLQLHIQFELICH